MYENSSSFSKHDFTAPDLRSLECLITKNEHFKTKSGKKEHRTN